MENEKGNGVWLSLQMTSVINYALQQNKLPVIQELVIHNDAGEALSGVRLKMWTEPEILVPFEQQIELIPGETAFAVDGSGVLANASFLAGLTEKISGIFHLVLSQGETAAAELTREITALSFDEWQGTGYYPELLTAFVMPNHPEAARINARAAELLQKWTSDPSLNAYQTRNPNRVLEQAAAVYGAMQAENIVYCVAPASFEAEGQRVRLCDAVIEQKLGNCLDLTLFYASCLEAAGLHPLLLLMRGHIFAGVWLEEMSFPESVQDDPSLITKRIADGVNEIAVVECTALTAGRNVDFDQAAKTAALELAEGNEFEYIVDVARARLSGVHPLPLRIRGENGWQIVREERPEKDLTCAPEAMAGAVRVKEGGTEPLGKLAQWERKLLDLGLRNTLINMRLSRSVIPVLTASLSELEDALEEGGEYGLGACPAEYAPGGEERKSFEPDAGLKQLEPLLLSEFQNKRLRSCLTEGELSKAVLNLYRSSRTSLEENGANTLYLTLGLLRWYETKASQKARYAPIVLLPVEIVRKSALKGYVIRLRDEEPQMNITLLEMLKQDFGIAVGGLDPLPQDEHGVNLRETFTVLRQAVMGQSRWDVVESAYLGIFSFSQFVMWNDVRNRAEDLMRNKMVKSLIDGKLSWEAAPMEIGDRVPEDGVMLPLPADASQLYAIETAAKGESFVLHGPPGTGKSQTITALIANALAQGKTVLFVAEKMAALSVVERRLDGIGIGPFCLEVHSNKARKRDVLAQLEEASQVAKQASSDAYLRKAEQLSAVRGELDGYAAALHRRRRSGFTLFEMVKGYEDSKDAPDSVSFPSDFAGTAEEALLERQRMSVERLIALAREIGHPCGHPLRHVSRTEYSRQFGVEAEEKLKAYGEALDLLQKEGEALTHRLGGERPAAFAEWERLARIAGDLVNFKSVPRAWTKYEKPAAAMRDIEEMAVHYSAAGRRAAELLVKWKEDFLTQDGASLAAQWAEAGTKWAAARFFQQNALRKTAERFARAGVKKEELGDAFQQLAEYQKELRAGESLFGRYGEGLGSLDGGASTRWEAVASLAMRARQAAIDLGELMDAPDCASLIASSPELIPAAEEFGGLFGRAVKERTGLCSLLGIELVAGEGEADFVEEERKLVQDIASHSRELREWTAWKAACREAADCGLAPFVEAYEGGLAHDEAEGAWRKALFTSLVNDTVDGDPALGAFTGALFNEKIQQFGRLDKELTELAKAEIFCRLAARVPNFSKEASHSSEVGILQRAIRSGGRGLSLRKLFEQIPNLLPKLCPCMLMSPISAAQYLDPEREPFDLVVFDEASQMPTCKAVGVLARGENAVIVGDPKQMPPTSFFSGNTVDEDNLDTEDLESILDDCLALHMPQTHLLWHYRSRHESLIAFSNHQFYDNKLYTFPSVNDRESKVSLVHVDGCFDRGKTRQNRAEAEAVVAELVRRCHDSLLSGLSVGVVTFNINQQNLIDDLFTEACREDSGLEAWAYEAEEPLFIKNLENVQGDERDVILFSVGYGPDAEGKVYMNFGPLNREGGWRRLNVAVSRARQEMKVFSTLTADQIDLSRASAQGVAALRAFLEYAGGTRLSEDDGSVRKLPDSHSGIADSLCEALEGHGYAAEKLVGHSEYRIDIGVVDRREPEKYIMGVLLDGSAYGEAKTTRDRELAQISVLRGLGWEIHRIWTADWWNNREKELNRLLEHIADAESRREQQPNEEQEGKRTGAAEAGAERKDLAGVAGANGRAVGADVEKSGMPGGTDARKADMAVGISAEKAGMAAGVSAEKAGMTAGVSAENAGVPAGAAAGKAGVTVGVDTGKAGGLGETDAEKAGMLAGAGAEARKEGLSGGADAAGTGVSEGIETADEKEYQAAVLPTFRWSAEDYLLPENVDRIQAAIAEVLRVEAPVSEGLLQRRILQSFGISRAGARIQGRTEEIIRGMGIPFTVQAEEKIYWQDGQDPDAYEDWRIAGEGENRREAGDIPVQEIANAVCQVLEDQVSLPGEELIRETAKALGYSRTGNIVIAAVKEGMEYAELKGRIGRTREGRFVAGGDCGSV